MGRLIIYSVGTDQVDKDGGSADIVFRLFDVAQRRQPPKPPTKEKSAAIPKTVKKVR